MVGGLLGLGVASESERCRLELDFAGFGRNIGRGDCQKDDVLLRFGAGRALGPENYREEVSMINGSSLARLANEMQERRLIEVLANKCTVELTLWGSLRRRHAFDGLYAVLYCIRGETGLGSHLMAHYKSMLARMYEEVVKSFKSLRER